MAMSAVNMPDTEVKTSKLDRALRYFEMAGSVANLADKAYGLKNSKDTLKEMKRQNDLLSEKLGIKQNPKTILMGTHVGVKDGG